MLESSKIVLSMRSSFETVEDQDQIFVTQQAQNTLTSEPSEQQNFIPLSKIPEQEKIQIIQTGFQFNQQGKISLKKYYESTDPNSLFQLKGYYLKFESVRRTKLYKNFKE